MESENKKQHKKVWIVDDDKIYQFTAVKMMHSIDPTLQIQSFDHGLLAFDMLKQAGEDPKLLPDLLLLDINMPVMNGWEFLDFFSAPANKTTGQIALYVISSSIDYRDMEKARGFACVIDYLVKPLRREDYARILKIDI